MLDDSRLSGWIKLVIANYLYNDFIVIKSEYKFS